MLPGPVYLFNSLREVAVVYGKIQVFLAMLPGLVTCFLTVFMFFKYLCLFYFLFCV